MQAERVGIATKQPEEEHTGEYLWRRPQLQFQKASRTGRLYFVWPPSNLEP